MNPLVLKLRYGAKLGASDRAVLDAAMAASVRVPGHIDLVSEGEPAREVHVVLAGFACRYKILPDGGRQILAWLAPGDFCDLHAGILGEMDHTVATLTPCVVGHLPRDGIEELTDGHPALARAFWWATLVDAAILREWLVSVGRRPGEARIAHLICEILVRLRAVGLVEDGTMGFPATQIDVADTVGLTPVHVNRIVQQLRRMGMIAWRGRKLEVLDWAGMQALAGFNPRYLHLDRAPASQPE